MSLTFQFVLFVLAVWSITRFVAADAWPPMRWLRRLVEVWGDRSTVGSAVYYLMTCFWCLSPYVAVAVWAVTEASTDVSFPLPALWIIAARPLVGILNAVEDLIDAWTR